MPIKEIYDGLYDGPHATPRPADQGPVFLGIKNVTDDGQLDLNSIRHIAEPEFARWTRRVEPRAGDIVFTYEATLNRYAIIPPGFRGCLGRRMALIRTNPEKIDTRFLHFYFFSKPWRDVIRNNMLTGATVDRIPLTKFPDFPVTIPDLPTQRKIAGILSAYDDLIENNLRRIKILEQMAQSLYREWFVHFRFPGHESATFKDSELGRIPEGWEVKAMTEAVTVRPKVAVPKNCDIPFVTMGGLSEDSMLITEVESRDKPTGARFQNGDTLFARITPCLENGKTGYVEFLSSEDCAACGSTEFIVLRSKTLCPQYVYLMARSDAFRDNAIKSMSGATGRQRVRDECFDQFFLAQPPEDLLARFESITRPQFELIHTLHRRNETLRHTRDLLLPKLLSGDP
jgi:type I restriction enzyme S subunit